MLAKRVLTSLVAIPLIIAVVWFGKPWLFLSFITIWSLLAITEFYRLVTALKVKPIYLLGAIWTLFFILIRNPQIASFIQPYADRYVHSVPIVPVLMTAGIIISLVTLLARKEKFNAFPAWAWTFAGVLYVGWLLGYAIALHGMDDGRAWVFFALFCTFGSDTTAFFTGRAFGRHKLAPSISPGKSWEGTIGGLFGAAGVSLLFQLATPASLASHLTWWQGIILALLVSVFGQFGDLVESLFKRNVGAKDSGKLMPGHGGILDRMDSVVFAVVVVYYWVLCITQ